MQNHKTELERREKSMVDTDIRPAYVDVGGRYVEIGDVVVPRDKLSSCPDR